MAIGLALIAFVFLHIALIAHADRELTGEVALYFWPFLFASGVYFIINAI